MLGRFFPHELDGAGTAPAGDRTLLLGSLCDEAVAVLDDASVSEAVQSERLDAIWCQIAALFPAEVFAGRETTALLWDGPLAELLAETVDALDDEGRAEVASLSSDADALLAALLRRSRRAQLLLFGV